MLWQLLKTHFFVNLPRRLVARSPFRHTHYWLQSITYVAYLLYRVFVYWVTSLYVATWHTDHGQNDTDTQRYTESHAQTDRETDDEAEVRWWLVWEIRGNCDWLVAWLMDELHRLHSVITQTAIGQLTEWAKNCENTGVVWNLHEKNAEQLLPGGENAFSVLKHKKENTDCRTIRRTTCRVWSDASYNSPSKLGVTCRHWESLYNHFNYESFDAVSTRFDKIYDIVSSTKSSPKTYPFQLHRDWVQ